LATGFRSGPQGQLADLPHSREGQGKDKRGERGRIIPLPKIPGSSSGLNPVLTIDLSPCNAYY